MKRKHRRPASQPDAGRQPSPGSSAPPPAKGSTQWFQSPWLAGSLLFALTLLAFLPACHAGFVWDDDQYVTGNAALRTLEGLRQIWFALQTEPQYYPLVHTTFWVEYHLWGLNPLGYHLVNLGLHAGAAVLLWRVLVRLQLPGAWLAAALFALHPVQVESVAWVTERKNLLSTVFYFSALLAYLRFLEPAETTTPGRRRWLFYFGALILFVAALLSKTVTCSLPAALLLVIWWKNGRLRWKEVLPLAPFFVIGLGFGLLTAWIEQHHAGAQGADWALTLGQRFLIAGRALWFYADKLVWPAGLTFIYPRWNVAVGVWWQWLFPLAAVGVVVALWLARRRIGRGPVAAVLFFAGTLAPALGFINVYPMRYSFVADHFQYLACAGWLVLVAAGIAVGLKSRPLLKFATGGVLLLTLGTLTWRQCGMYANLENLWRVTIQRNPNCWMAYNNLGLTLLQNGQTAQAVSSLQRSLKIYPDNAQAYDNLGAAMNQIGQLDDAVLDFKKALEIDPDYADVYYNLGHVMARKGQLDDAIADYQQALKINPNDADSRYNLGFVLMQAGRLDEAIDQFQKELAIRPDDPNAYYNLANTLLHDGRPADAVTCFEKALTLAPQSIQLQNNLAWVLATSPDASIRNGEQALALAQSARQLSSGNNPIILATLAAAYAETGQFPVAVAEVRLAMQQAAGQTNNALMSTLRVQLNDYEQGIPFRDQSLTNAAAAPGK